ncbi:GNAT family N-acetyltransferase [Colwellia sp. BRX8-7]|jgi:ElaA protein|uniref:GNAT family N-acetyltransferase n=1 Tax=Colwellia sp. BRX8-7 TaxID=2759833 RepID=UPI0015F6379C|nr:GNAT family N-acetyltransferase [Colwellia sp. BRX8-7]MBA6338899.1 GNAT family N-acetyltransferase [Colwellia sp. BRX8-7]
MKVAWQVKHFKALNIDELYEILKLRIDVFVVEQTCFYADIDDIDRHEDTVHLFCYLEGKIAGYLRILAKGQSYREYIAIGRVIVASHARGTGLGHQLMAEALTVCQQYFPDQQIKISAQEHLESFYGNHGFERVSAMYLEDDIPHIAMLKVVQ